MRFAGQLVRWEDERGFGFIQPDQDLNDRIFVHIKAVLGGRPQLGDRVEFELQKQPDGRYRAVKVQLEGSRRVEPLSDPSEVPIWMGLGVPWCFMHSIVWASIWGVPLLIAVYPGASFLTYGVFLWDKKAAQSGNWRVAESTLHALEMAGGWPGSALAQQVLRHKTRKASYQFTFSTIAIMHTLAWAVVDLVSVLFP